jgi:hypothetical protein
LIESRRWFVSVPLNLIYWLVQRTNLSCQWIYILCSEELRDHDDWKNNKELMLKSFWFMMLGKIFTMGICHVQLGIIADELWMLVNGMWISLCFLKELHLSGFGRLSNNNQKLLEYSGKAYWKFIQGRINERKKEKKKFSYKII